MKCFLMKPISAFRSLIALRIFSKTFDSVFVEHVSSSVNLCLPFTKDAALGAPPAPDVFQSLRNGCSG
jgi:hypothetical protein